MSTPALSKPTLPQTQSCQSLFHEIDLLEQASEKGTFLLFDEPRKAPPPSSLEEVKLRILERKNALEEKISQLFDKLHKFPLSLEMIEAIANRKGKPIGKGERSFLTHLKKELPHLNKALIGYELLQKKTDNIDVAKFKKKEIAIQGETFTAYDISDSEFSFIVHAKGLDSHPQEVIENVNKNQYACSSLISHECPDFYHQTNTYAMVLSVNPNTIVATTNEDGWTPTAGLRPDLSRTDPFYKSRQRWQILTGYVDRIYAESQGKPPCFDNVSTLLRLLSSNDPDPDHLQRILALKETIPQCEKIEFLTSLCERNGMSFLKLQEIKHSDKDRCKEILSSLLEDDTLPTKYIQPLQSPVDLLNKTRQQSSRNDNLYSLSPYNEINISLEHEKLQVRALLFDGDALELRFKDALEFSEKAQRNLRHNATAFRYAKEKNIPILIKYNNSSLAVKQGTFLRGVRNGNSFSVERYLLDQEVSSSMIERALQEADELKNDTILITILKKRNDISPKLLFSYFKRIKSRQPMFAIDLLSSCPSIFHKISSFLTEEEKQEIFEGFIKYGKKNLKEIIPQNKIQWALNSAIENVRIPIIEEMINLGNTEIDGEMAYKMIVHLIHADPKRAYLIYRVQQDKIFGLEESKQDEIFKAFIRSGSQYLQGIIPVGRLGWALDQAFSLKKIRAIEELAKRCYVQHLSIVIEAAKTIDGKTLSAFLTNFEFLEEENIIECLASALKAGNENISHGLSEIWMPLYLQLKSDLERQVL